MRAVEIYYYSFEELSPESQARAREVVRAEVDSVWSEVLPARREDAVHAGAQILNSVLGLGAGVIALQGGSALVWSREEYLIVNLHLTRDSNPKSVLWEFSDSSIQITTELGVDGGTKYIPRREDCHEHPKEIWGLVSAACNYANSVARKSFGSNFESRANQALEPGGVLDGLEFDAWGELALNQEVEPARR